MKEQWCIPPEANAEFVCAMEDVLEVYHRPYDEKRPVICLDEASKPLVGEVIVPIPAGPGQPERFDYEYVRNGTANLFMLGQMPPPTYQVAATTCLSSTFVRRRALTDRRNAYHEVTSIGAAFLQEVTMSKRACPLNAVVRSSRPSDAACPNARSLAASASLSPRSITGSSRHEASDWTASAGRISRRSLGPPNAHRPPSRA